MDGWMDEWPTTKKWMKRDMARKRGGGNILHQGRERKRWDETRTFVGHIFLFSFFLHFKHLPTTYFLIDK